MLFCMFVRLGCAESAQLSGHVFSELQVPSFIVNERTKGTTVTPQGPKEDWVAAHLVQTIGP